MNQNPIGVMMSNFLTTPEEAIQKAAKLGLQGVQIGGGELPKTSQQRKEMLAIVKGAGLRVSALCGGGGFTHTGGEPVSERIERTKRMLDMALEMETNVVTSHIGIVPADPNERDFWVCQEALNAVGTYGKSIGATFAIETGPETAPVLKRLLDTLDGGIGVNLDPANLVMCSFDDPVRAVYLLKDYIVHTHAKDGKPLGHKDWWRVGAQGEYIMSYEETPLGLGDVDYPNYLKALKEIGYQGFLTIEREVGDTPESDIALAANFLRSFY